jgi:putative transposase
MEAERLQSELLKLTFNVAQRTIQKYMRAVPSELSAGQSWAIFPVAHGQGIWTCDFVPGVKLFFNTLHDFVIVNHNRRRMVHVGVTDHPTYAWIFRQMRDAKPFEEKPRFLICDNDKRYGPRFGGWPKQHASR